MPSAEVELGMIMRKHSPSMNGDICAVMVHAGLLAHDQDPLSDFDIQSHP